MELGGWIHQNGNEQEVANQVVHLLPTFPGVVTVLFFVLFIVLHRDTSLSQCVLWALCLDVICRPEPGPQELDGADKGNGGQGVEANGVEKHHKDGGGRVKSGGVDAHERVVAHRINDKPKCAPDHDQVDMLDDFDGGALE